MNITEIQKIIGKIPHMTSSQGELIYNMILDNDIFEILELGIAHGTGSCYMAAALDEKGKGSVLTIDNKSALKRKPNVNQLLKKCNLEKYVTPVFANSSYNWELMKLIENQTTDGHCEPIFDFCYIDGSHNFELDCCAFFLVDKLLKPGGFILFDDMNWTYSTSPSLKKTDMVKRMSDEEKNTPHIKTLVELIVVNHPNYSEFSFYSEWFLTRKKGNVSEKPSNYVNLENYKSKLSTAHSTEKKKNILSRLFKS